jgi:uncharacterized protein DUF2380
MKTSLIHVVAAGIFAFSTTVAFVQMPSTARADDTTPAVKQSVAFFGFRLINSSSMPASEAELNRVKLLDAAIAKKFTESGRFTVIPIPSEMLREIEKEQHFGQCQCEAVYGKKLGAKLMGWGTVEKISDLLLTINVYVADVNTNNYVFTKSVNIRENVDSSWLRGLRWLMRYYLDEQK